MLKNKMYVWLIFGLMFGLVLGIPLQGTSDVVVGINHWSRDAAGGFLFPSDGDDDVNLSGNELLDANLSRYAGDDVSWDSVDLEFDVTGGGSSKWNRAGTTLFTKVNGDSVQLNGSLDMNSNDIDNAFDVDVENQLTVANDIKLGDKLEYDGGGGTHLDFNPNQIIFAAGGSNVMTLVSSLLTLHTNVTVDENLTVDNDVQVDGTTSLNDAVQVDANLTIGTWKPAKAGRICFLTSDTYIGLSNVFPPQWVFNTELDVLWYLGDLAFDGGDLVFEGNYTQFLTKNNENMQFEAIGGDMRFHAGDYTFNAQTGGGECGTGNVSFYNGVDGGNLMMYIPGSSDYINMSTNVSILENLTVSENVTAAQFNVVNAPYTWNIYVDVNGTLVWEME